MTHHHDAPVDLLGVLGPVVAVLALLAYAVLVAHARRFGLPLIAITAKPASTLARAADVVLALPQAPEACPLGLAPTTSTTMQLALGDALAVALLTLSRTATPGDADGSTLVALHHSAFPDNRLHFPQNVQGHGRLFPIH